MNGVSTYTHTQRTHTQSGGDTCDRCSCWDNPSKGNAAFAFAFTFTVGFAVGFASQLEFMLMIMGTANWKVTSADSKGIIQWANNPRAAVGLFPALTTLSTFRETYLKHNANRNRKWPPSKSSKVNMATCRLTRNCDYPCDLLPLLPRPRINLFVRMIWAIWLQCCSLLCVFNHFFVYRLIDFYLTVWVHKRYLRLHC